MNNEPEFDGMPEPIPYNPDPILYVAGNESLAFAAFEDLGLSPGDEITATITAKIRKVGIESHKKDVRDYATSQILSITKIRRAQR